MKNQAFAYGQETTLAQSLAAGVTTVYFVENYFPDVSGLDEGADVVITDTGNYNSDDPADYETITLIEYNGYVDSGGGVMAHSYQCLRDVEGVTRAWDAGKVAACLITARAWQRMVEWIETIEGLIITDHGDLSGVTADQHHSRQHSISSSADHENIATDRILGRISAGAGPVQELTAAGVRTLINVANGANNYSHPATKQCDAAPGVHYHDGADIASGFISEGRGRIPGSNNSGLMAYNGDTKAQGRFYAATAAPTNHTPSLKFDGELWSTVGRAGLLLATGMARVTGAGSVSVFNSAKLQVEQDQSAYMSAEDRCDLEAEAGLMLKRGNTGNNHGPNINLICGTTGAYTGTGAIGAHRTGSWGQGRLWFAVNDSGVATKADIPIGAWLDGPAGRFETINGFHLMEDGRRVALANSNWRLMDSGALSSASTSITLSNLGITGAKMLRVRLRSKDGSGNGPIIRGRVNNLSTDTRYRTGVYFRWTAAGDGLDYVRTVNVTRPQIGAHWDGSTLELDIILWRNHDGYPIYMSDETRVAADRSDVTRVWYYGIYHHATIATITSYVLVCDQTNGFASGTLYDVYEFDPAI